MRREFDFHPYGIFITDSRDPTIVMSIFSNAEHERLHALLDAISQIESASIVANGMSLSMSAEQSADGEVLTTYSHFDSEPFRSLAMSVRLVYMAREPANFTSICNILYKSGEPELQEAISELRGAYNRFLDGPMVRFNLHGEFEGTTVGPREVFETWLYGGAFHQDSRKKAMYEELRRFGPAFTFGLHAIVTQIVQFMLHLGLIVASVLDKARHNDSRKTPDA